MKTINVPRNVKKAFALSSLIGSALISAKNGDPKLTALHVQINRAMRVFNVKAGNAMYWSICNEVFELWSDLSKKHNTSLNIDEVSVMVEYMCMLIPPKDFDDFYKCEPYKSSSSVRADKLNAIVHSVLDLDKKLNALYGTKPYTLQIVKQKVKKVKKVRDVSKKIETRRNKAQAKEERRLTNVRSFLQDRIKMLKGDKL